MVNSSRKVLVLENLCTLYRVGLYEELDKVIDMKAIFFSTAEEYYDGHPMLGDFNGQYIIGLHVAKHLRINPHLLWRLLVDEYSHVIKCINGPLEILCTYVIARLRKKRFILWTGMWHHPNTLFHKVSFPFAKYIYRHSDAIIVYGSHVKRYLISLGVPSEKISIAWQVQDNSKFERPVSAERREETKKKLGITTSRVILFIGRLVEQKGIRVLLEAYRSLKSLDVSLLLVGSGPLEEELKGYISSNNRVFHIQRVPPDGLHIYYAISDILVLPSITTDTIKETWGFVINEAMCQGCAIVTSNAVGAGVGGLVEEEGNGCVVPENDSEALKGALDKLLSDDQLLESMKKRSKEIIKDWTYPKMAEGFIRALEIADRLK